MSRRICLLAIVITGCSTGTWKSSGFSGKAPSPTIVAPADCVSPKVRDRFSERHSQILGEAVTRMVGQGGAYSGMQSEAICQEVGAAITPFGHMPDSRDAVVALARAANAAAVLVPVVQRSYSCHAESLAVRNAAGQSIGSVDTGGTVCDPYPTELRLFLFAANGELLWAKWVKMDGQQQIDPDVVRGKVAELFAKLPATVTAKPEGARAPAIATLPGAATMAAAAPPYPGTADKLPDGAPVECVETWKRCDELQTGIYTQQCRSFVFTAVAYNPQTAPQTCKSYGTSLKSFTVKR